jgi:hypothetical protein
MDAANVERGYWSRASISALVAAVGDLAGRRKEKTMSDVVDRLRASR